MTTPPIVDTHAHLDDAVFDPDRDDVLQSARSMGVRYFVNIGHIPDRWESSRALREANQDVGIVLGVHPQHADEFTPAVRQRLHRAVRDMRPLAVGETGFDFARAGPTPRQQEVAFLEQLELAAAEHLPTIIHQRDASAVLIALLDTRELLAPIVLHSFDGTDRLADWAVARGCYIGIGGLAAKRGAAPLRSLLARMPLDRLLLETDSPYLAPPGAADRRNTPATLPRIAEILAPLWGLTGEDLCRITTTNASELFGIPAAAHAETSADTPPTYS